MAPSLAFNQNALDLEMGGKKNYVMAPDIFVNLKFHHSQHCTNFDDLCA
jgi:hypothetical protein